MPGSKQGPPPVLTTRCPRCGYDQRGVIATWTGSCPLEGVCSECGVSIRWREVLAPDRYGEHWNIERQPARRRLLVSAAATYLRSFLPWSFWSRLRMTHAIRGDRLALYGALLIASLLFLYALVQISGAVVVRYRTGQSLEQSIRRGNAIMAYLQARTAAGPDDPAVREAARHVDPFTLAHYEQLDDSQRRVILGRSLAGQPRLQATVVPVAYWEAVLEALVFPTKIASSYMGPFTPYVPPAYIYDELAGDLDIRGGGGFGWRLRVIPVMGLGLLVLAALLPLEFALLPASRRRARVRWAHLARIAVYSGFLIHAFVGASVLLLWSAYLFDPSRIDQATFALVVIALAAAVGIVIFWAVAIKRYLLMPHGASIAVVFALLSVLLTAVVMNL